MDNKIVISYQRSDLRASQAGDISNFTTSSFEILNPDLLQYVT